MLSNGFRSSSRISEQRRRDKDAVVNAKVQMASGMKTIWSVRLKDEKSAEQGIFLREEAEHAKEQKRAEPCVCPGEQQCVNGPA